MQYLAGKVVRYHTNAMLQGQTLADHQWGVTVLLNHLFPDCSKQLLMACLTHDVGEYRAGDLPYGFKKSEQGLKLSQDHAIIESELAKADGWEQYELTVIEQQQLQFCDRLEALLYACSKYGALLPSKWLDEYNQLSAKAKALGLKRDSIKLLTDQVLNEYK